MSILKMSCTKQRGKYLESEQLIWNETFFGTKNLDQLKQQKQHLRKQTK